MPTFSPVTDVEDPLVGVLAERQVGYRTRFRYADDDAARAAARDLVEQVWPDSRLWRLPAGGFLWLGADHEHTPVLDVDCPVEDVDEVRGLASSLAGAPLSIGVPPGDPLREAWVGDGSFRRFAANLRLELTARLPGEHLADRVSVEPMTPDDFASYRVHITAGYAAERQAAGESSEEARRQAESIDRDLLPHGLDTARHHLFTATHDGQPCGVLWLCDAWPAQGYVYDVEIAESHRGRGLGAALMVNAALWSRERGHAWLGLNVFGHNHRARSLYEQLGYVVEAEHFSRES